MKYKKNNYYKSSIFLLLVVILLVVLASGCVSQKKYEAAQQEIARLSVDSTFQEYEITEAKFKKDGLIYEQQNELAEKSKKLDSLKNIVAQQRSVINQRKTLLNSLKSSDWEAVESDGELVIKLEDGILFGTASNNLNEQGMRIISSVSAALQRIEDSYEVWVVGHTDNRSFKSDQKDNWELSAERSLAVVRALIGNDIDPSIITASAKSKYDPDVTNRVNEGRKLNRRTEIIIVPKTSPYKVLSNLITG